jgi:tetratricopeptide (TPR) repeat protein
MGFISKKFYILIAIIFMVGLHSFADDLGQTAATNSAIQASIAQLQEQLRLTQMAMENAAKNNSELLSARIQSLEQTIAAQHTADLETAQKTQQFTLLFGGLLAVLTLAVLLLMAYFQWRALAQLVEISKNHSPSFSLPGVSSVTTATVSQMAAPGRLAVENSNNRLLGTVERLERRIAEMEQASRAQLPAAEKSGPIPPTPVPAPPSVPPVETNGHGPAPVVKPTSTATPSPKNLDDREECIANLIAEGQSLLNNNESGKALECFEAALGLHPNHCEALVKKGTALERLGQFDEALACYDLSIKSSATTIAYLQKGGLLNRMSRYDDALKCYEFALNAQDKKK